MGNGCLSLIWIAVLQHVLLATEQSAIKVVGSSSCLKAHHTSCNMQKAAAITHWHELELRSWWWQPCFAKCIANCHVMNWISGCISTWDSSQTVVAIKLWPTSALCTWASIGTYYWQYAECYSQHTLTRAGVEMGTTMFCKMYCQFIGMYWTGLVIVSVCSWVHTAVCQSEYIWVSMSTFYHSVIQQLIVHRLNYQLFSRACIPQVSAKHREGSAGSAGDSRCSFINPDV